MILMYFLFRTSEYQGGRDFNLQFPNVFAVLPHLPHHPFVKLKCTVTS